MYGYCARLNVYFQRLISNNFYFQYLISVYKLSNIKTCTHTNKEQCLCVETLWKLLFFTCHIIWHINSYFGNFLEFKKIFLETYFLLSKFYGVKSKTSENSLEAIMKILPLEMLRLLHTSLEWILISYE